MNNTLSEEQSLETPSEGVSRRGLLNRALGAGLVVGASAWAAGCSGGDTSVSRAPAFNTPTPLPTTSPTPTPTATPFVGTPTEADILQFALNLEYLEAEYYLRGVTGTGLNTSEAGTGAGAVTGGRAVTFASDALRQYFNEVAADERAHVNFLRSALTSAGATPVARPAINFTDAFNAAAQAAGLGANFDPFANETNFLLGAFVFEDVGVTAYLGGVPFLNTATVIEAAAGIYVVEAIHAGTVRTLISDIGGVAVTTANAITRLRGQAGGGKEEDLQSGNITSGGQNIVPSDGNGRSFSRTASEVLRVVYLTVGGNPGSGGFFPSGMNGRIRVAG